MIVGHPVGNDYDLGGRFLAKYLTRHIPGNPTIVVSNMPAASSVAATNFFYTQAPRDGTVFGSFSRNIPSQALMRQANLDVDPRKLQLARRHRAAGARLRGLAHGQGQDPAGSAHARS